METFDKKQTSWEGLWYHQEYNGYSSKAFNLKKLKNFKGTVRFYMYKNRNIKGTNRPNYVICIKDSKSDSFNEIEIEEDESIQDKINLINELKEIMHEGNHNADVMRLPSETQADAQALMKRAIEIIEQLTNEKWNFQYLTF